MGRALAINETSVATGHRDVAPDLNNIAQLLATIPMSPQTSTLFVALLKDPHKRIP